ncbi:hypothetical protein DVA43_00785 [Leclercia sp. W6]|uniref:hypothetical protein n=1 Tax=Leclercia sp. W6 TaxID=2282310 RepID=UPI000DF160B0|nr:hypothetical protein [Leclercia sp. W6]AXF58196.1 hypothetical protein DVA43_00785 [Leclercia sp. W6]
MKTVELLAKHLNEWPKRFIRIVQGGDSSFYGVLVANELCYEQIENYSIAGLQRADDAGLGVTQLEWMEAQMTAKEKGIELDPSRCVFGKEKSDEEYREDHLYSMKLQCLHAALIQDGRFDKTNATNIAEAINAGFDAIK